MCGDHMFVPKDGPDSFLEMVIVPAAGIGLVTKHQARPLTVSHGRGAAVRQQLKIDTFGGHLKQVIASGAQQPIPLLACRTSDRLYHFDLERLRREFHAIDLLNRASSDLNACGPPYSKTYLVMSKSGAGLRSRNSS